MNGIMITLIIVFVLDLIGCFITARMEVKRENHDGTAVTENRRTSFIFSAGLPFPRI